MQKRGTAVDFQEQFLTIYNEKIHRAGAQQLLEWLRRTDFFEAPASTRYHCACRGGLVQHSVSVYETLCQHFPPEGEHEEESYAICGLLHDVCKANFYKQSTRNVKNEQGRWEQRPYYAVEDQFPYGHGEKSVFLIERFLRLKTSEAMAIRWHMGGFDDAARGGSSAVSQAYQKYPLAVKLHAADFLSTYLVEVGTSAVPNGHPKPSPYPAPPKAEPAPEGKEE